ncbi:LPS-assembly lipoprotein LptE [Ferrimonas aestuarii]|uniref:LPS-assembly lipoprotein LptE n=1 Tax=Ferrimonas aestuarii TaxID=2569539 RepID=UPI001E365E56|nr:LPS assembly lipoprotein LptE [Ferrimonas aestuarii]
MLRTALTALLSLAILASAGCGFHLKSDYLIPTELQSLRLESSDKYGELHRLVQERLRLSDIEEVTTATAPRLWLGNDNLERSTLSLFPSGQVAEYELIYSVRFSVTIADNAPQNFDVEIRRDYLDDPRTALAKNRELELLLKEMRVQAADQILRTLSSIQTQ